MSSSIRNKIETLGLSNKSISIHTSLKSFTSRLSPNILVNSFLDLGCTVITPTFSYNYLINPGKDYRPDNNDWDYDLTYRDLEDNSDIYSNKSKIVDSNMGAVSKIVLNDRRSVRGNHPLDSLTALGEKAQEIILGQEPMDLFYPFRKLVEDDGYILLMGVNYNRMTFIHHCEKLAGRKPFLRWASNSIGEIIPVEIGGCSEGFNNLSEALDSIAIKTRVCGSQWKLLKAREVQKLVTDIIATTPEITYCDDINCGSCNSYRDGGPRY